MAWSLTASGTQAESYADPVTMDFDCNGAEILILCLIGKDNKNGGKVRGGTAPTYNGIAMTDCGQGQVTSGSEMTAELWYLVNPAAGSNTLSIPNPNSVLPVNTLYLVPICTGLTGVNTSDPLDISAEFHHAGSTNPYVTLTTSGAGKLVIDSMASGYSAIPSANSHTLISSQDNGSETSNAQYTTDDFSSGGTLSWTVGLDDWVDIGAAFNEAGGGPINYPINVAFNIGITPSVTREVAFKRTVGFSIGVSPTVTRMAAYARTVAFNIGLTPALASAVKGFHRTVQFAINVTASASRAVAFKRTIPFNITVTPTVSRACAYARTIAFNIGVSFTAARQCALSRLIQFAINIAASITAQKNPSIVRIPGQTKVVATVAQHKAVASIPQRKVEIIGVFHKVEISE